MGHIIAHPTETLFGLAADPFHPIAVKRLLKIKRRPFSKGLIVLIPDQRWLERLSAPPSPLAKRVMAHFWPGPLTLVLPPRLGLPESVIGARGGIALRHSSSPVVASLMRRWQKPLISTSANAAGQPPLHSSDAVRRQWGPAVSVVLEGHIQPDAQPSTLVQLDAHPPRLLRAGAISIDRLRVFLPDLEPESGHAFTASEG